MTEKAKKFVENMEASARMENINISPAIFFKSNIKDTITPREKRLVDYIVGTYLIADYSYSERKEATMPPVTKSKSKNKK